MTKRLAIRLDGGGVFGFGHAKRCVALSKFLEKKYDIKSCFYSRFNKNLEEFYLESNVKYIFSFKNDMDFKEEGFINDILDKGYKVLFLDKLYPYSEELIKTFQKRSKVVLFHNDCEGLTKVTKAIFPVAHLSSEVLSLISDLESNKAFYGPKYVLLNEEVTKFKKNKADSYITITTGASDPEGVLLTLLKWINESDLQHSFVFLEGFDMRHKKEINDYKIKLRKNIIVQPFSYELLFNSSLVISAFGVTPYEIIYHNIPVITVGHAFKNALASKNLEKNYGVNIDFGFFKDLSSQDFITKFKNLIKNQDVLESLIERQEEFGLDPFGMNRIAKEVDLIFEGYE